MKTLRIIASLIVTVLIIGLMLGGMNTARSAHNERIAEEIEKERARIDRLAEACAQRWPARAERYASCMEGTDTYGGIRRKVRKLTYRTDI